MLGTRLCGSRGAAVALAVVGALVLAGCGDSSGSETGGSGSAGGGAAADTDARVNASTGVPRESGLVGVTHADAEPQQGGTLSLAVYTEARGLDPSKAPSAGTIAGMETAAIYDVLARYDPETGEYEAWMAESLEHSEDYATWTLTLREGVEFTDGTPLNAEAVVFSFNRAQEVGLYSNLAAEVERMETPDDYTVVFHLREPWTRFPYLLSYGPGRVPSPTAVRKWGEDFGQHPVGAGPFVLEEFAPGEEMVLSANEDYWGDGPYLDKLRFVPLGGAQAKLDALEAGGIQAAFFRDADTIAEVRRAGYGGFVNVSSAGEVLLINNAEGHPGSDQRIRKAIAHAFNTEQFNQRVFDGKGLIQKELMARTSVWATDTEATPYDPEAARHLVTEAKKDGFSGALTITTNTSPTRMNAALALQAQLDAVGFDVSLEQVPSPSDVYGNILKGTYDLSFYGISIPDAAPWTKLVAQLHSEGAQNRANFSNQKMNTLINELHDATSQEAKRDVLNEIQALWTDTVPTLALAAIPNFIAWDDSVHGITPTAFSVVLFSEAWLSH